ncbi:MAG: putative septum site-determining protein divIVA [Firmicutes bacterium]|nr:putative septum site-determining protein divIVA [Bacillota bacterium]
MRITSMEITNKEFKKGMRGYNQEEVDEYLDRVAEDYEALYKENSVLKEKVAAVDERLEHYRKMETTIQNTLVMAQDAAEQARSNSKTEAELIVRTANETAKKIIDKANNDVIAINAEFERTRQEFNKFRAKYRNFMKSQLEVFDDMEKEVIKHYSIGYSVDEAEFGTALAAEFSRNSNEDSSYSDIAENIDEIKTFFEKEA